MANLPETEALAFENPIDPEQDYLFAFDKHELYVTQRNILPNGRFKGGGTGRYIVYRATPLPSTKRIRTQVVILKDWIALLNNN